VVLATVAAFVVAYALVRFLLTALLRRLLAGNDPQNRGADRALGAVLGATKAGALAFFGLCAVTFVEHNVIVAGKRYVLTPKNSVLARLAREYNVVEHLQFSGARSLAKALEVATSPAASGALRDDPDYQALMKDPRFRALLAHQGLQGLLASGDLAGLLRSAKAGELLEDARMRERLERLGEQAPSKPPGSAP
jgi:membrane protein required for colicin V production